MLITTPDTLEGLVSRLKDEAVVGFDLEADSLHHYREKVCLIQIATTREVFLVDPLAIPDITALGPLLANPLIRKVFHGADYDIRSLYRDFSFNVRNLIDTMIACQFLGEKEVGLAAVLKKRFEIELDKRYQKADWSRRPLDPQMVTYAAADTSYLVALYAQLKKELTAKGRLSWVEEESELLSEVRAVDREGEPFYCRFKGASRMDSRTLAVLEELLRYRDERARLTDRPPFKVLSGDTLRALAERTPKSPSELKGIPGLPPRSIDRYGKDLLRVVAEGCSLPDDKLPRICRSARPDRDALKEERYKKLKHWREAKAQELGISAGIFMNNNLLETIAKEMPQDTGALEAFPTMRNWQKHEFGDELLAVLR